MSILSYNGNTEKGTSPAMVSGKPSWHAVYFTVPAGNYNYLITSVKFRLIYRLSSVGTKPSAGALHCEIRSGLIYNGSSNPGTILATSNSILETSLVTCTYYETNFSAARWYEFVFSPPYLCLAGNTYVIVIDSTGTVTAFPTGHDLTLITADQSPWADSSSYGRYYKWNNAVNQWQLHPTYKLNTTIEGSILAPNQPYPLPDFPETRPVDYDPDAIWTPSEEPYTQPDWQDPGFSNYQAAGGGRWGQQLVAVGKGLIYYEDRE